MVSKNEEYLIHGTQWENAIRILQMKKILANPPKKYKTFLAEWKPTKQIFTQLIYKDIPNQEQYNPGWGGVWIVLSKQLLKDYPFYATGIGGFLNNFEDAFNADNDKIGNDEIKGKIKGIIIKGEGNLDKIPNLTKLKNHIKKGFDFMHSHEILFGNDIPLEKYCVAVIANFYTDDNENREMEKLCGELNIPYTRMEKKERKDRFKPYGLNKFLGLVDGLVSG